MRSTQPAANGGPVCQRVPMTPLGRYRTLVRSGVALVATAAVIATMTPSTAVAADLLDTPVLALAFEGSVTDSSAEANPVTVKGNGQVDYVDGMKSGTQALRFNGGSYLDLGTKTALQPANLTLSFWINPSENLQGENLITWNKSVYNSDGWYLASENNSVPLSLSVGPANGQPYKVQVTGDRNQFFPAGQWTHVAVTYDAATKSVAFYRNGLRQSSVVANNYGQDGATGVLGSDPSLPKTIGFNGPVYNGSYLRATLDEYRLYNGVASLSDVSQLYEESGATVDREAAAQGDLDKLLLPETASLALTLPTQGTAGSTLTWASPDESVIGTDGSVHRPSADGADAVVTLTASARFLDGPTVTREFQITVPALTPDGFLTNSGLTTLQLDDAYLNNAADKEHQYLLSLDSEKFLYEFYKVAGLPPTTDSGYGGWERSDAVNFRGHAFGHYMSALAMSYAGTRDATTKQKLLDEITQAVGGLQKSQDAYAASHPDSAGYISAFRESALDAVQGTGGTDENVIVPWYNLHKVLAGLIAIHQYVGGAEGDQALAIASKFGEYVYQRMAKLPDKSVLLRAEYGGMNDALYDLFAATGNAHFKSAAEAFDEVSLFRSLAAGQDVLPGRHANTTIPKFIGALKRYQVFTSNPQYYAMLTDQEKADLPMYLQAAQNFFQIVNDRHTFVTGSNSQAEHFHDPDGLYAMAAESGVRGNAETSETCNEYNMLKLARELFRVTREVKYADFYENTFINTVLGSQNPETGMTIYFQPQGAGYEKIYNLPFTEFWCCTGTGMENFSKLGDSMYFTGDGSIWVNMFFSSSFTDPQSNVTLTQTANLPSKDTVSFTVQAADGGTVKSGTTLRLRVPDWIDGSPTVIRNGQTITPEIRRGYVLLSDLAAGDTISYRMPMKVLLSATKDNPNYVAFKYGPTVLSAKLGNKNTGASEGTGILVRISTLDPDAQQIITTRGGVDAWKADVAQNVVRVQDAADGTVQFQLKNTADAGNLVYTPHFSKHDERYGLYMNLEEPDSQASQDRIRKAKEQLRNAEIAVDSLYSFDSNNFEAEKGLQKSANSSTGIWQGRQYRDAKEGGWFSYDLAIDPSVAANYLSTTYFSGDAGRSFDVYVNDEKLKTVTISNAAGQNVFYIDKTELPAKYLQIGDQTRYKKNTSGEFVLDADGNKIPVVTVRFQSTGGLVGGLYGVQIDRSAGFSTVSDLTKLQFSAGTLSPVFAGATRDYTLTVPADATSVDLDADPQVPSGLVTVDGVLIDDTQARQITLPTDGTDKTVKVVGFVQDHATSSTYTVTITRKAADTTAPAVTVSSDPADPTGTDGWFTTPVMVSASATDDSGVPPTLQVSRDGGDTWDTYRVQTVSEGTSTLQFRAADGSGNVSDVVERTVKVDAAVPTVTSTTDAAKRTVTVTGTDHEPGAGVAFVETRVDGGSWVKADGGSATATVGSSAATVEYRATDGAGNVSVVGSASVPAASNPAGQATVKITSADQPSADGWYNQNVVVGLTAPAGSGTKVQYRVNGGSWKNYGSAFTLSANGSHVVDHRLIKNGVLVDGSQGTLSVKIDKIVPSASVVAVPSSASGTPRNPVTLTFTGADTLSGLVRTEYRINDGQWVTADPEKSLTIDTVGSYLVSYRSVDEAGNVSGVRTVTVRIAEDPATVVKASTSRVARGAFITFAVKGYDRYDTVTIKAGDREWASVFTDVNGTARVTVKVAADTPTGATVLTAAGSDGDPSSTVTVTVR